MFENVFAENLLRKVKVKSYPKLLNKTKNAAKVNCFQRHENRQISQGATKMAYIVQGMKLIPQALNMSCWYASAQMLINWRQEESQQSIQGLVPPELDAECVKIRDANNGILNPEILKMAKRIGLEGIPPMSPTPEALEGWLKMYGPLWVNGKSHIVVIAGITNMPFFGHYVKVYDPSPVNVGDVNWRSLSGWYVGNDVDARDTGQDVETVFLHCPQR
jgi:Papain-like cysteine protease AvrRpt2